MARSRVCACRGCEHHTGACGWPTTNERRCDRCGRPGFANRFRRTPDHPIRRTSAWRRLAKRTVEAHVARDALYRGAVASVYPSLFEGFGLPVLESMALGCPVVTSCGTATEELVGADAGIAVDPRDPGAIAGGLARLLDDDAAAAALRTAGRRRAAEFTWDRAPSLVVDGYRELA